MFPFFVSDFVTLDVFSLSLFRLEKGLSVLWSFLKEPTLCFIESLYCSLCLDVTEFSLTLFPAV